MTDEHKAARSRHDDLRATWNQATGAVEPKDRVLLNAIRNPRIAGPYGSDRDDTAISEIGVRGVDTHIRGTLH